MDEEIGKGGVVVKRGQVRGTGGRWGEGGRVCLFVGWLLNVPATC